METNHGEDRDSHSAVLLLVLLFIASEANAQFGRGGGGGGRPGIGGGGGRPGGPGIGAPRIGGPGIGAPRIGGPGLGAPRIGGPRIGGPGIGAPRIGRPGIGAPRIGGPRIGTPRIGAPRVGGSRVGAPRIGAGGRITGRPIAAKTIPGARFVGASPRAIVPKGSFVRPGLIRTRTAIGNRAITNAALRSSIAPTLYRGRFRGSFRGSYWPWWYGGIAIGWVGPVFWPYVYDDFFDFVFWPYVYDDFWPYAYDNVYFGIYGAYAYAGPEASPPRAGTARAQAPERRSAGICSEQAPGLTDLPIERISQTVRATDEQRALLDELKAATARSIDILRAACPTELPSVPPGRLAAMESRLQVMLHAVQAVRPALDRFYEGLSDEQKARFNAVTPAEKPGAAGKDQRDLARLCSERAPGIADLPIERIAKAVQPTAAQQPALDELKEASGKAADRLKSDCPTYQALTPTGRAEAMEKRLSTVLDAMKTVQPALANFYEGLTDEQKARFNTVELDAPAAGVNRKTKLHAITKEAGIEKWCHAHGKLTVIACFAMALPARRRSNGRSRVHPACQPAHRGDRMLYHCHRGSGIIPAPGTSVLAIIHIPFCAAAEAVERPNGSVVESFGRVWLYVIADQGWRAASGERVAVLGPFPIVAGRQYTARYMEEVRQPGPRPQDIPVPRAPAFRARGFLCGERWPVPGDAAGTKVTRAGEGTVVPEGPPMTPSGVARELLRHVFVVLHMCASSWMMMEEKSEVEGLVRSRKMI